MCEQQRLRPACAYAQSDQSLCLSLEYPTSVRLLTEHHLEFLSLKGGCTASSESTLVKMPHCWKSHAAAHIRNRNIHMYYNGSKCLMAHTCKSFALLLRRAFQSQYFITTWHINSEGSLEAFFSCSV